MDLQEVYNRLELTEDCLIKLSDPDWKQKVKFPSRVSRLFETNNLLKELKSFFYFDNKPLILFFENPIDKKSLHKAIWNLNESPIAIIIENNAVEIYNGFAIEENTKCLKSIGGEAKLTDFSYFEMVTGKTWEKYAKEIEYKNRVDYRLLQNIEAAQHDLTKGQNLSRNLTNALLGKIIFIRYLIDRNVCLYYKNTRKVWTNDDLCTLLKSNTETWLFFEYLQNSETGFNGDMFKLDKNEFMQIPPSALQIIIRLLKSEDIATGQRSLFDIYDFSILPIEFISNVYERFIGKENQNEEGAYYTPTFLVDYIIEQTVAKKLESSDGYECKVLDPACGSGIFLVESLRRIIEKYIQINKIHNTNTNSFRKALHDIASNNIFGIDKDYSAVQVALFSVYLTLLDYQTPADIENFKFPKLMGTNFICSDTFDLDNFQLKDFENRKITFDFIIGNPPWKGSSDCKNAENYIKKRGKQEEFKKVKIGVNNKELAEYFVFRTSDFCSDYTEIALIIHSSSLYNSPNGYSPFRDYLLANYNIRRVLELSAVRKDVFSRSNDPAIAPAAVLFFNYAKEKSTDNNIIEYISIKPCYFFSLFKMFSIASSDIQYVQQKILNENDWLWKVLVYGSYLDFNFIQRIKKLPKIKDIIIDQNRFVSGTGIEFSRDNSKYDSSHLIGQPIIDVYGIDSFYIDKRKINTFNLERLGRIRKSIQDIFIAPMLICRHGIDSKKMILKTAISFQDLLFKKSVLSIKVFNSNDVYILKNIACVFSSDFFSYLAINTFSSVGIERENAKDNELYNIPYIELTNDYYSLLENATANLNKEKQNTFTDEIKISKIKDNISSIYSNLEKEMGNLLNLNEVEKDIIDYALTVSKTFIFINSKGKEERINLMRENDIFWPIPKGSQVLTDYAQVFLARFSPSLSREGNHFIISIWYSQHIIGMRCKVVSDKDYKQEISIDDDKSLSSFMSFFTKISYQQITDRLFAQKDVRGFEKDGFYIFKPNEKRLWHKAIAHLDANEFVDAMLMKGRDNNGK